MRTAGELSGLAVVSDAAGERLGRVQDVLFETSSGTITGLLVRTRGGLLAKSEFLPRLFVRRVGPDAVLVEAGAVLQEMPAQPDQSEGSGSGSTSAHALDGRPVLDVSGRVVGDVADVLIDEVSLRVDALLLSGSFLGDLLHGKPRLPLAQVQTLGQDSVVTAPGYDPKVAGTYPAR